MATELPHRHQSLHFRGAARLVPFICRVILLQFPRRFTRDYQPVSQGPDIFPAVQGSLVLSGQSGLMATPSKAIELCIRARWVILLLLCSSAAPSSLSIAARPSLVIRGNVAPSPGLVTVCRRCDR